MVQVTTGSGSGSGFIVDADGLVITNEHVVAGERTVSVWLTTGRRSQADVLDWDPASDLALVQIDGGGIFDANAVGHPRGLRVGDEVLALGFPLADRIGKDLTVTRGIISSTRTSDGVALLQTDAPACYLAAMLPSICVKAFTFTWKLRDNSLAELPRSNHCSEVAQWDSYP